MLFTSVTVLLTLDLNKSHLPKFDNSLLLSFPVIFEILAEGKPEREEILRFHIFLSVFWFNAEKTDHLMKPSNSRNKVK